MGTIATISAAKPESIYFSEIVTPPLPASSRQATKINHPHPTSNKISNLATRHAARRKSRRLHPSPENQSIEQKQYHRAYDRHDPTGNIILAREEAADPGADKRPGDPEQNGDDTAA